MADSRNSEFIDFVLKEYENPKATLRGTARKWSQRTGETCDKSTVKAVLEPKKSAIELFCEENGIDYNTVSWWGLGKNGMYVRFKKEDNVVSYHDIKDEIIQEMNEHAPKYPTIKRQKSNDWRLFVISPADLHIGKLASKAETWELYNKNIAVSRALEWLQWLLNETAWTTIDQIVFVGGNDILHIDTPRRTTTSWTPQDTDGMRHDNFTLARKLYVDMLETLIAIADVHFVFCPSNHDFMSGFMLCDSIASWFHNSKNITFDVDMRHRKYYRYHNNLMCFTHWDGAKQWDVPLIMASESKDWSECENRYIFWHHVHHKTSKDYIWVTYESFRSLSWTDWWHDRNWYVWVPKSIEAFTFSKQRWQIGRFNYQF